MYPREAGVPLAFFNQIDELTLLCLRNKSVLVDTKTVLLATKKT